jgi:hypothetical protein
MKAETLTVYDVHCVITPEIITRTILLTKMLRTGGVLLQFVASSYITGP